MTNPAVPLYENINGKITVRGPLALVVMLIFWIIAVPLVLLLFAVACIVQPFIIAGKIGRKLGRKSI